MPVSGSVLSKVRLMLFASVLLGLLALSVSALAEPAQAHSFPRTMKPGMSGSDVKELQIRVAGWAADGRVKTYVKVDGKYGSQTKAAVKRFQRAYGLQVDGIAGPQTIRAIKRLEDSDGSTAHFAYSEFYSKDGSRFSGGKVSSTRVKENVRRLMYKLEAVRKKAGNRPIYITSGFRSVRHNTNVNGAPNSQHMYGIAADYKISGLSQYRSRDIAMSSGFSGIKRYSSWVHADSRIEYPYGAQRWWWVY